MGGASRRFGAPKALAPYRGESLAERAYRTLGEAFATVIAVGKSADALPLPFLVLDDGSETRAAMVGVAAGLRLAKTELCVFLPTDMPDVTPGVLRQLARAASDVDAAVPQTGPLPGAYRRTALPIFERRIAVEHFALYKALGELDVKTVEVAPASLANVNEPADL